MQAQDDRAISERIAVEGGSGVYEAIDDQPDIDDAGMALDTAVAKLLRDGLIRQAVTISTDQAGLASGQVIQVSEPNLALAGAFLVHAVRARDIQGAWLRSTATLLSGDAVGGWVAFYRTLMAAKRRTAIPRDNEVLLLLRAHSETVTCGDSLVAAASAVESRVGVAVVGYAEVAA